MSDLSNRIQQLSGDQRAALLGRLRERREQPGVDGGARFAAEALPRHPDGSGEFPLSYAQEQLWFLQRLVPQGAAYNVPVVYRLRGGLDAGALGRALSVVVARHESLRTVFAETASGPVQRVVTPAEVAIECVEVEDGSVAERFAAARAMAEADSRRPFDLAAGPPWRVRLLRLGPEDHVLVLVLHHVVCDGWSLPVLLGELAQCYAAEVEGRAPALAPLALQYADVAVAQRRWLDGGGVGELLGYWRERLAGLEPLELPADRPRPAVQSFRGGSESFTVGAEVAAGLRALGRERGATLFMVLLAAFDVLLWRYSGREDVAVASAASGRTHPDVAGLVGYFVNTLVLRADLSGDPSFAELLGRVRESALGAYGHQDLPFERLVAELSPQRDPSRSPLVQVMLGPDASTADGAGDLGLPGIDAEPVLVTSASTKFDLLLGTAEVDGGLRLVLEYSTDLFDAATVRGMGERLCRVLERAVADPHARLSALAAPDAAERAQLEARSRAGEAAEAGAYARSSTVHARVAEQAARAPDAVAVTWPGDEAHPARELTYAELDGWANRIANALVERGVRLGDRVAVCSPRLPSQVAAMLGTAKSGAAYVPLDPDLPPDRLAFMLAETAPRLVVAHPDVAGRIPTGGCPVQVADDGGEWLAGQPERAPEVAVTPDDTFYVPYTSGSTGRPKGTEVPHRSVFGHSVSVELSPWTGDGVVTISHGSVSWDLHLLELWTPLTTGGRAVLYPGRLVTAEALREIVPRHGCNRLFMTPQLFNNVVDIDAGAVGLLEVVTLGGESPSAAHLIKVLEECPDTRLVLAYGPVEASVYTTLHGLGRALGEREATTIGKPIGDRAVWLLDERFDPVPPGVVGELCIGGPGIARGYLARPALTAQAFVPDPFAGEPGARLYRTGDLARWQPDGTLEFLGRRDTQVKVRGVRVELGEVEHALREHPSVDDAAVLAPRGPAGRRLVAYVVSTGGELDASELRTHLAARLPEAMLPSAYVPLDALPLRPTGKLDHRALPDPGEAHLAATVAYVAPRTPVEEALVGIAAELLGHDPVGVHDNFFSLGGHSLLATMLVARVRERLDAELPLQAVFTAPDFAVLAEHVDAGARPRFDVEPLPRQSDGSGEFPLSYGQEQLWFLQRLVPQGAAYNVPVTYRLRGGLDAGALGRALSALVARHESLRTVFAETASGPVQRVLAPFAVDIEVVEVPGASAEERLAAARQWAKEDSQQPFDLSAGPPWRVRLLRVGDGDHVLSLALHHVVCDGWSLPLLLEELGECYAAQVEGREAALAPLEVQYADVAVAQRRWLDSAGTEELLGYWRERLAGLEPLELPTDRPRPAVQSFRGGSEPFAVGADIAGRLRALGREQGATLFMVLLAAYDVLLWRYSGCEDVAVASATSGRIHPGVAGLVGYFVNPLAFRTDLSGDPSFVELLGRVRESALGAYAHQDMPFERLVAELSPERDPSRSPLVQVMFALGQQAFGRPGEAPAFGDVTLVPAAVQPDTAQFDLGLAVDEREGGLEGMVVYNSDLFDAATARRIARNFEAIVTAVAARPHASIRSVPLDAGERARLEAASRGPLAGANARIARTRCVHEFLEEQADRRPDAVAFVDAADPSRQVTFAEFDARANRVAHALRAQGLGTGDIVVLYANRSISLLVTMYGVMKSGAAYVPVDVLQPQERLGFAFVDVRPRLVIADARWRERVPEGPWPVLDLDESAEWLDGQPTTRPDVDVSPDDLLYVCYTSGSTGRPKGTEVPHRSMTGFLDPAFAPWSEDTVMLHHCSIAWDGHLLDTWPTLASGGRVVIYGGEALVPCDLRDGADHAGVNTVYLTVTLLDNFIDIAPHQFVGLECIVTGGEAPSAEHLRRLHERYPDILVVNGYGPSETTIAATAWQVDQEQLRHSDTVPLGTPVGDRVVWLLDDRLDLVPLGAVGELCIGGPSVSRGYLKRPRLTAQAFVPDPFGDEPGARLYRTGDLARMRADGTLEFLGRRDDQVKVRGFRVELGDIEHALRSHPGVEDAAVLAPEGPAGRQLVAYVVTRGDDPPQAPALRAYLGKRLPDYMVPAFYMPLDALPVTSNGKLDRRALPEPNLSRFRPTTEYAPPETPLEEMIVEVLEAVLARERVGIDDDFFALGGHSLLAAQVVMRMKQRLPFEPPLLAVFERPTPRQLAAHVEQLLVAHVEGMSDDEVEAAVGEAAGDPGAGDGDRTP